MAEDLAATMWALLQAAALPAAAEASAGREITALMDMLLPPLVREPSLEVRVHPAVLEEVSESLRQGWPELAPLSTADDRGCYAGHGGCSADLATWRGAARYADALWRELREVLAPYGLPDRSMLILKGAGHGQ
jgi:hypothetical protein